MDEEDEEDEEDYEDEEDEEEASPSSSVIAPPVVPSVSLLDARRSRWARRTHVPFSLHNEQMLSHSLLLARGCPTSKARSHLQELRNPRGAMEEEIYPVHPPGRKL